MLMNILFLDFDGVLNNERVFSNGDENVNLDPYCVKLLIEAIEECTLQVVVSSSWRKLGLDYIIKQMTTVGFSDFHKYFHADWESSRKHGMRGLEIDEWLSRHPEVSKYLILDDDSDFFDYQPRLLINTLTGLTLVDQLLIKKFFGATVDETFIKSELNQQIKCAEFNRRML